jgi:hypothetical protein
MDVFRPSDKKIIIFESVFIFSIILQVILIPVSISFEKSIPDLIGNQMSIILLLIFILEIPLTLNSGFYENGELVTDRRKILEHYVKN